MASYKWNKVSEITESRATSQTQIHILSLFSYESKQKIIKNHEQTLEFSRIRIKHKSAGKFINPQRFLTNIHHRIVFSSQFQCEFITIGGELKHDHEEEEEGMRIQGIRTN